MKRIARGLIVIAILFAALGLVLRAQLRASLPILDGQQPLPGASAAVNVTRDALGVPTITGATRADVARALGFLHAQDRFFQMDLMRRRSAGELAALVGKAALPLDRGVRVQRLRPRAERVVTAGSAEDRQLLQAYAEGANAGLRSLGARSFEYLLLRSTPEPWRPEDSILVAFAMFLDLNDENGDREAMLATLRATLPEPLFAFLTPSGSEWDAPAAGSPGAAAAIPGADVFDLRHPARQAAEANVVPKRVSFDLDPLDLSEREHGSNNWAVDGAHAANGGALLADDMHLGINVPNIWYRAALAWGDPQAPARVFGVTLPGTPMTIVGSNTRVAWGFTNTTGDWSDLIIVEADAADKETYRTPDGPRRLDHVKETIRIKGQPDETLDVAETIWGPIVRKDAAGRPLAIRWIAHEPEGVNLGLVRVERAASLEEALDAANAAGVPPQNFVCVDASGRIGWTVMGRIPRRVGFDGRLPVSWAGGDRRWDGWLSASEYPRIVDPAQGRIWTANSRVADFPDSNKIGESGGYAMGARQKQIRDDLRALDKATASDMLKVQLDDRAVFLERWQELLLGTLASPTAATDPRRAELKGFVENWGARASVDSVGYRAVRAFRTAFAQQTFATLTAAAKQADSDFEYLRHTTHYEAPLWALVTERPLHLLDGRFKTWDDSLLAAADAVITDFTKDGGRIRDRTWGERNTARIQHSLSRAVPQLGRFLDMPKDPLPGDSNMPRVLSPNNGASQRMVVSPGRESEGFFHMPGGQSGHPLSEFYAKGHSAWVKGEPTPFLPGPAAHTLILKP